MMNTEGLAETNRQRGNNASFRKPTPGGTQWLNIAGIPRKTVLPSAVAPPLPSVFLHHTALSVHQHDEYAFIS